MRFVVYGKVLGKPRPRVNRNGIVWTDKRFRAYERAIADEYMQVSGVCIGKPLELIVDVYRALPKSRPKKLESEPDTYKPDADNIAKIVMDALNGIAYKDDSQVVSLTITKHPRTRTRERLEIEVLS